MTNERTDAPKPSLIRFRASLLLLILVSMAGPPGCGSTRVEPEVPLQPLVSPPIAMAPVIAPSVDAVMMDGDMLRWAEKGFEYFGAAQYHMALPYFEASLESRQTNPVQRAYLYWFAALAYRQVAVRQREIDSLESFLLATANLPEELVDFWVIGIRGERVTLGGAREQARAKLGAYRIERGKGFGTEPLRAVPVRTLAEENLVLSLLSCGENDASPWNIREHELQEVEGVLLNRMELLCAATGEVRDVFFDVTELSIP